MAECKGRRNATRGEMVKFKKIMGPIATCHREEHKPMWTSVDEPSNERRQVWRASAASHINGSIDLLEGLYGGLLFRSKATEVVRRPWVLHANGWNKAMMPTSNHRKPAPARAMLGALKRLMLKPPPELLRHPVLLIDSATSGACSLTTLGRLLQEHAKL